MSGELSVLQRPIQIGDANRNSGLQRRRADPARRCNALRGNVNYGVILPYQSANTILKISTESRTRVQWPEQPRFHAVDAACNRVLEKLLKAEGSTTHLV